ncbi:MAG: monovalent cation/H(+) antiporter subunit G, partial [Actinobacteria bacterium]|nr:monovalent cation/H(+) antiporter subunit G [Actinomycetota bacterium]
VLLLAGSLLALLAAVGLHRFPDLLCRMHAATKPATLGLFFIALGVGVTVTTRGATIKLLLVVVLQFLTTPVAAHMVGRAAYRSGVPLSDLTVMDELGRDEAPPNRYGVTS